MQTSAPNWFIDLVAEIRPALEHGEVSQYLPELAAAHKEDFGIAIDTGDEIVCSGSHYRFTIQSVVKVITVLLSIDQNGVEETFLRSGCDHSHGPYDSASNYDAIKGRTANPFVNAGALVTLDALHTDGAEGLVAVVLECVRVLSGNPALEVNMKIAESEYRASDRNRSIAYHLASYKAITHAVDELLWAYCQICSIEVGVLDLARISYKLSGDDGIRADGISLTVQEVRAVRRLLLAVGMYEASAEYACAVGVPAKCGVSGSMMAILPHRGVGIYGPALNETGNSAGGVATMQKLASRYEII